MAIFSRKPKVYPEMTEEQKAVMKELEKIAGFMDTSWIKICGMSLGADAVVGLVPVVGDVATSCVAAWVVFRCLYSFDPKLRRRKAIPMLFNVLADFTVGAVPVFGDVFDVFFKANVKNINIVRKHYGMERFVGPTSAEDDPAETETKKKKRWGSRDAGQQATREIAEETKEAEESETPADDNI